MGAETRYVVTGEYVTASTATPQGVTVVGFLKGRILPADVPQETIAHLLRVGLIAEDDEELPEGVEPAEPTGPPPPAEPPQAEEPAKNASTEEWQNYARSLGAQDADLVDAEGKPLGRDDLVAKFAAPEKS